MVKAASENKYRKWPECGDILEAARHLHASAHPKVKPDDSWVEKATGMADATRGTS